VETNKDSELLKQRIKTALEATSPHGADAGYVEWFSTILASLSSHLRVVMSDAEKFNEWVKMCEPDKETSEYDQERLKWIRYRQSRSETIDNMVKSKDKLARLIKEGEVDIGRLMTSSAEGDVRSLVTVYPFFGFVFQRFEPSWWERFIIFLLRRKIATNPS